MSELGVLVVLAAAVNVLTLVVGDALAALVRSQHL